MSALPKMCQSCWVTPATTTWVGADGVRRHRCTSCAEKRNPYKAKTPRQLLEGRIFSKTN